MTLADDLTDLVDNPSETLAVEYKSGFDLSDPRSKANFARHVAALSNHGGGYLVFGFNDDLTRAAQTEFPALDRDTVAGIVKSYLDPPLQCDVRVVIARSGARHTIVVVPSHGSVPVYARRDGPQDTKGRPQGILNGACYIRKPGPASESIATPSEWAPLIRRCALAERASILGVIDVAYNTPEKEEWHHAEKLRRQSEARRYLAPELNRTIDRVLYIHGRSIPNFVCASVENGIKPNDRKEDFLPYWPTLCPNAPQCHDLAADDAAALIAFYDSLHSLADFVNEWWERDGQLSVNIFNMILHHADKALAFALICVERFELERLCPPPYESWGTISLRIQRSMAVAADARKHHIARFEAKTAAAKTFPQQQRPHRRLKPQ
jgi:hypothetical protein